MGDRDREAAGGQHRRGDGDFGTSRRRGKTLVEGRQQEAWHPNWRGGAQKRTFILLPVKERPTETAASDDVEVAGPEGLSFKRLSGDEREKGRREVLSIIGRGHRRKDIDRKTTTWGETFRKKNFLSNKRAKPEEVGRNPLILSGRKVKKSLESLRHERDRQERRACRNQGLRK